MTARTPPRKQRLGMDHAGHWRVSWGGTATESELRMFYRRGGALLFAFVATLLAACVASERPAWAQALEHSAVTVVTRSGARHRFTVEVAATPAARQQGLMFRREMARDAGMLFDFKRTQPVSFWMRNTFIPLDMIFIRADGTIANVAARAVPRSETPVPSKGAVRGVLEINGGLSERLGIAAGDRVLHAIFGTAE